MTRGLKLWKLLVGLAKKHTRNRDDEIRFALIFVIYILPEMNSGLRC